MKGASPTALPLGRERVLGKYYRSIIKYSPLIDLVITFLAKFEQLN